MKTKTRKMLPKIAALISNGGIYYQSVRCGKSNCKCARGEKHEAYYFFTRIERKLTKTYIRKAELEQFSEIVSEAQHYRQCSRQALKEADEHLRISRAYLRENKEELEKRRREFPARVIRECLQALAHKGTD
jgi:hypothetical protein